MNKDISQQFIQCEQELFIKRGKISVSVAVVLVLLFWLVDWIYAPHLAWSFLAYRLAVIPTVMICLFLWRHKAFREHLYFIPGYIVCGYLGLYTAVLISLNEQENSPYYAGLNLVTYGSLFFLPWRRFHAGVSVLLTYLPYVVSITLVSKETLDWAHLAPHLAFCSSTIGMGAIVMELSRKLRFREFESQYLLNVEILTKDAVIAQKSKEAVHLEKLSRQFSQSVIDSVRIGSVSIDHPRRVLVTCLFIDIESSTGRSVRIDYQDYVSVLSDFFSATAKILLDFNLTVSSYLGDGMMAFANAPVYQPDHQERTLKAALEILRMHAARRDAYIREWRSDFNIRIGINTGFASVGFFPAATKNSYTAVSPQVTLASRLCSYAERNSVAITKPFLVQIGASLKDAHVKNLRVEQNIKGFEGESIEVLTVLPIYKDVDQEACPRCQGRYSIVNEPGEIQVVRCMSCGFTDVRDGAISIKQITLPEAS